MVNKEEVIRSIVVKELPLVHTREVIDETENPRICVTQEEALTEILDIVRELKRKLE